jgi:antitoxin (DNA-binding transcriptional repressor) of toxin-antitoxin stability system
MLHAYVWEKLMRVTATRLRADIYVLLDRVLETGEPLEIERGGRWLRIVPAETRPLAERLPPRPDLIAGEPQDLVSIDWSDTWRP